VAAFDSVGETLVGRLFNELAAVSAAVSADCEANGRGSAPLAPATEHVATLATARRPLTMLEHMIDTNDFTMRSLISTSVQILDAMYAKSEKKFSFFNFDSPTAEWRGGHQRGDSEELENVIRDEQLLEKRHQSKGKGSRDVVAIGVDRCGAGKCGAKV
jgi:hypothetical protein